MSDTGYKRSCEATTKAGKPCRCPAVRGSGFCIAHDPEKAKVAPRFQAAGGRPKKLRAVDVLRKRIEADIDRWLAPLEQGLTAERGIVVGDGKYARVEYVADIPTRLKAMREAFDRAFGKPAQTHDVTLREMESEVDREIRDLLGRLEVAERGDRQPA